MKERAAIDTNIVIRYITNDVPKLARKAYELLSETERDFIMDEAVISEAVHVLEYAPYNYPRPFIAAAIKEVMSLPNIVISERDVIEDTFELYLEYPKLSYIDCYLSVKSTFRRCLPLYTFDKKLAAQLSAAAEP